MFPVPMAEKKTVIREKTCNGPASRGFTETGAAGGSPRCGPFPIPVKAQTRTAQPAACSPMKEGAFGPCWQIPSLSVQPRDTMGTLHGTGRGPKVRSGQTWRNLPEYTLEPIGRQAARR